MQRIIRYNNRKLYNKNTSSYIELEDIKNYVITGTSFIVTDKSGIHDYTDDILASTVAKFVLFRGKVSTVSMMAQISDAFRIDTINNKDYINEVQ